MWYDPSIRYVYRCKNCGSTYLLANANFRGHCPVCDVPLSKTIDYIYDFDEIDEEDAALALDGHPLMNKIVNYVYDFNKNNEEDAVFALEDHPLTRFN